MSLSGRFTTMLGAALLTIGGTASAATPDSPPESVAVVAKAVTALGGEARVTGVRNITLAGYAQYAWLQGAEEISASPHAPQKFAAVNDMRRVYDLEHDRFQITGRSFLQFPFLAANAYNFTPFDQRLDGDIAYDQVPLAIFGGGNGPLRIGDSAGAGGPDGATMRRMWMLNNPVVLARALMRPTTVLSIPPVASDATSWLMSARVCAANLLHAAQMSVTDAEAINLPALLVSMDDLLGELGRYGDARGIRFAEQPEVRKVFGSYPPLVATRAMRLGFVSDGNVASLVADAGQGVELTERERGFTGDSHRPT